MKIQLHQILAVEGRKQEEAQKILKETQKIFGKEGALDGLTKEYTPVNEDGEKLPSERKEFTTTALARLLWTKGFICDSADVTLTKDRTNARGKAVASLEVGGIYFGEFSAAELLSLEKILKKWKSEMFDLIPTLDHAKKWVDDKDFELAGVRRVENAEITRRTRKEQSPLVLYDATDKHPAQVQVQTRDVHVGNFTTVHFSGKMTSKEKADILTRVTKLIDEVIRTRSRANQAEVSEVKEAGKIFDFILGDIAPK